MRVMIEVTRQEGVWSLTIDGVVVATTRTQKEAVIYGRLQGRALWKEGKPAELKVHGRNGRYQVGGATYGRDPSGSPG